MSRRLSDFPTKGAGTVRRYCLPMASARGAVESQAASVWGSFLEGVRSEINVSVERTIESLQTMPSYQGLDRRELGRTVRGNFEAILDGIAMRRRPDRSDDSGVFEGAGRIRGRQGVAVTEMLTAWRVGLGSPQETAPRVAPAAPERQGWPPSFPPLARTLAGFAMGAAAGRPPDPEFTPAPQAA